VAQGMPGPVYQCYVGGMTPTWHQRPNPTKPTVRGLMILGLRWLQQPISTLRSVHLTRPLPLAAVAVLIACGIPPQFPTIGRSTSMEEQRHLEQEGPFLPAWKSAKLLPPTLIKPSSNTANRCLIPQVIRIHITRSSSSAPARSVNPTPHRSHVSSPRVLGATRSK
jgi:hypothetical protein